jgi:HSP20 family molecular chaperone IbpA
MWIRTIVSGSLVFVVSGFVAAQGLFDFDDIPGVDEEPAVAVDINPAMMEFIRGIAVAADPASADVLTGLRSMRLRVYHDGDNSRRFSNFMDEVTEELEDAGWLPVVAAQDEGSKVRIHMQMTGQEVSGMTVMVSDGSEAIFINIDGTVSAEDLGRVMAMMPVEDVLGSLRLPAPVAPSAATPAPAD